MPANVNDGPDPCQTLRYSSSVDQVETKTIKVPHLHELRTDHNGLSTFSLEGANEAIGPANLSSDRSLTSRVAAYALSAGSASFSFGAPSVDFCCVYSTFVSFLTVSIHFLLAITFAIEHHYKHTKLLFRHLRRWNGVAIARNYPTF